MNALGLRDAQQLMSLKTKSPLRMSKTVLERQASVLLKMQTVHRL